MIYNSYHSTHLKGQSVLNKSRQMEYQHSDLTLRQHFTVFGDNIFFTSLSQSQRSVLTMPKNSFAIVRSIHYWKINPRVWRNNITNSKFICLRVDLARKERYYHQTVFNETSIAIKDLFIYFISVEIFIETKCKAHYSFDYAQ